MRTFLPPLSSCWKSGCAAANDSLAAAVCRPVLPSLLHEEYQGWAVENTLDLTYLCEVGALLGCVKFLRILQCCYIS